jgi:hypothetical protein
VETVVSDTGPQVFVAAAAVAPGAEGSFFVTDVDIHNAAAVPMLYQLYWLPRDSDNADPVLSGVATVEPGACVRHANVLAEVFGLDEAYGALGIGCDPDAALVMSRTFNQGDEGTYGQGIPGYHVDDMTPANERVRVLFLTEDQGYRSNLGLLNGVGEPITLSYELFAADGTMLGSGTIDLPAWGNTQLNRVLEADAPQQAAFADLWTTTEGAAFTCYGSVLDNVTSDPTTVLPQ